VRHITSAVDHIQRPPAVVPHDTVPPPELYNLAEDPGMTHNVIHWHADVARKLHREHVKFLQALGMPEQYLQHRLEL